MIGSEQLFGATFEKTNAAPLTKSFQKRLVYGFFVLPARVVDLKRVGKYNDELVFFEISEVLFFEDLARRDVKLEDLNSFLARWSRRQHWVVRLKNLGQLGLLLLANVKTGEACHVGYLNIWRSQKFHL